MNDAPRKIHLEITTECNLDCAMCIRHAWRQDARAMAPATFDRLCGQLGDLPGGVTLQFGGFGEPLLHPHLFAMVARAKRDGLAVEILTNGVLLDERARGLLLDLDVDRLFVSLDGVEGPLDAAFHSQATDRVLGHLRALHRAKLTRRAARPEVAAVFVAGRRNVGQLPALQRKSAELGISRIVVTNLIPYRPELSGEVLYTHWATTHRGQAASPWNPSIEFPRIDPLSEASRVLDYLAAHGSRVSVNGAAISGGGMHCRFVGEGRLAIDAEGRVSPCLSLLHDYGYYFRDDRRAVRAFHVGNLYETPLAAIWNSPRYTAFRDRVRRFDFSPCLDCTACELRATNEDDCFGSGLPSCGDCLWAAGVIQCP